MIYIHLIEFDDVWVIDTFHDLELGLELPLNEHPLVHGLESEPFVLVGTFLDQSDDPVAAETQLLPDVVSTLNVFLHHQGFERLYPGARKSLIFLL